jgi:hypothetical protein
MTLDTHTYIKELQASGFTLNQAEVICYGTQSNFQCKDLVTKNDLDHALKDIRIDMDNSIHGVKMEIKDLRTEMHAMENKLTVRLGAMLASSIALLVPLQIFVLDYFIKK